MLQNTIIIRLVDGDDRNEQEIENLKEKGIMVLGMRHIESYLWSDEILEKYCIINGCPEKVVEVLDMKNSKMQLSINRKNPKDDVKSASNEIYQELKKILGLTRTGNDTSAFLRDRISTIITKDTETYKLLDKEIFG